MLNRVLPLSFIVGTRFFGLFIVLPVLSLEVMALRGADELLGGLLVGIYALCQMIFQVPFGILSDKIGRKKALFIGLCVFIVGCVVCAIAADIYTMLLGRALQGMGAIGAVATALIADFTSEEERSKAMAVMGIFIGLSFCFSMVLSPVLCAKFELSSLFWLSAILTIFCIFLLFFIVPKEPKISSQSTKTPIFALLFQKNLALMNFTAFTQKMLMSVVFFLAPLLLVQKLEFPRDELWQIYLASMCVGFAAMSLAGMLGERRGFSKGILILGVCFFIISYTLIMLSFGHLSFMGVEFTGFNEALFEKSSGFFANSAALSLFVAAVVVFFVGFNLHEPIMQSCASKFAKSTQRGAALGIFNACGYFGSFVGGALSGILWYYLSEFLAALLVLCVFWLVLLTRLKNPSELKNLYLPLNSMLRTDLNLANSSLSREKGIIEIYKNSSNLIIKYDSKLINEGNLREFLKYE